MGLWGAVAGIATITGPVLGGLLVQTVGWEWIFYVNIPVGVVALVLARADAARRCPTANRSFDGLGVLLSIVGMFLVVFGVQEGATYDWGTITGPITVWSVIGAGVLVLVGFVLWQRHRGSDALLPLSLFHHRNFSLANVAGWAVTLRDDRHLLPVHALPAGGPRPRAAPGRARRPARLAASPGVVAPFAGRLSDKIAGKWVVASGFALLTVAITWLALAVQPDAPVWHLVLPMVLFGVGTGALFSPLANLATSGLDGRTAGAGAGAFNTTRQIGGVIGSAAVVAMLTSRLARDHPGGGAGRRPTSCPRQLRKPFVDGFASGNFASGAAPQLPSSVPADVAAQIQAGRAAGRALRLRDRGHADDAAHGRRAGARARRQPRDEGRPPGAPRARPQPAPVAAEV